MTSFALCCNLTDIDTVDRRTRDTSRLIDCRLESLLLLVLLRDSAMTGSPKSEKGRSQEGSPKPEQRAAPTTEDEPIEAEVRVKRVVLIRVDTEQAIPGA